MNARNIEKYVNIVWEFCQPWLKKIIQNFDYLFYLVGWLLILKISIILLEKASLGTMILVFTIVGIIYCFKKWIEKWWLPSFQKYIQMEGGFVLWSSLFLFYVVNFLGTEINIWEIFIDSMIFLFVVYSVLQWFWYCIQNTLFQRQKSHKENSIFTLFLIGWWISYILISKYISDFWVSLLISSVLVWVSLGIYQFFLIQVQSHKRNQTWKKYSLVSGWIFLCFFCWGFRERIEPYFIVPPPQKIQTETVVQETPTPVSLPSLRSTSGSSLSGTINTLWIFPKSLTWTLTHTGIKIHLTPEMFQQNLTLWNTGTWVRNLQDFLASKMYLTTWINGKYDENTQKALRDFLTKECGWWSSNQWLLWPQARACILEFLKKQESKWKPNSEK